MSVEKDTIEKRSILRNRVTRVVKCEITEDVLDERAAVLVTLRAGAIDRTKVFAAVAWDRARDSLKPALLRRGWKVVDVLDGRKLWYGTRQRRCRHLKHSEVMLSNCRYGCKIYRCDNSTCAYLWVGHSRIYGCRHEDAA